MNNNNNSNNHNEYNVDNPHLSKFTAAYIIKVVVCVVVYLSVVSFVPIHNNWVLKGFSYDGTVYKKYNYPLTLSFCQTLGTAVLLLTYSVLKHFFYDQTGQQQQDTQEKEQYLSNSVNVPVNDDSSSPHTRSTSTSASSASLSAHLLQSSNNNNYNNNNTPSASASWIFGPRFRDKVYYIAPVGVIFGLKLGASNWGLSEVPITIHLLLQSSSLVWTTLFSTIAIGERLTAFEILAVSGTVVGTVFISLDFNDIVTSGGGAFPLFLNLFSCVLEGASITTLRYATSILSHKKKDNNNNNNNNNSNDNIDSTDSIGVFKQEDEDEDIDQKRNTGLNMDSFEFTSIKLLISSLTLLPFFLLLEVVDVASRYTSSQTALVALYHAQPLVIVLMAVTGSVVTLIFQVNVTMFCVFATAITVGLVGDIKVIPQTLTSVIFQGESFSWDLYHIFGLVIIFLSLITYTLLRAYRHGVEFKHKRDKKVEDFRIESERRATALRNEHAQNFE